MSFITGQLLIDAPASALNNLGNIAGERNQNSVGIKHIRTKEGAFPYVSAQAFRYWLREVLEEKTDWVSSPVYREEKIAYTDANPIDWWDDDLLGYMKAPSKKASGKKSREDDTSRENELATVDTVTRISPLRVSTLVSLAPVEITNDFGVMSRQEGNPVPHEHQFYRATLQGLLSLDLHAVGTFSYKNRTGYRNLDTVRTELAVSRKLDHLENEKSYRLPHAERVNRIGALLDGLANLEGGAKQTLHYTDVAPPFVIFSVTKGGNNIFGRAVGVNSKRQPVIKTAVLDEILEVYKDELLSDVYIGWAKGYLDEQRSTVEEWAASQGNVHIAHPRQVFATLVEKIAANPDWIA